MRFLKKIFKPSKKPVPPENPAHRITNTDAERDRDSDGEYRSRKVAANKTNGTDFIMTPDTNHGEGSRIVNQDGRIGGQQLPAPNASTMSTEHGCDNASERSDRNLSNLHSTQRGSTTPNRREHEDCRPGAQQHSETAPERTFGGGQDDEDADDSIRSGKSRGRFQYSGHSAIRAITNLYQSRREVRLTGILGVLHLRLNSPRGQPKRLVHSKPSWHPSLVPMLNIRYTVHFGAPFNDYL